MPLGRYKNPVFKGGGVKGSVYVGALEMAAQQGLSKDFERPLGSSAGAITALLVALGYTPAEMHQIMMDLDFSKFEDKACIQIEHLETLVEEHGWYSGAYAFQWLQKIVAQKTGNPNTTFAQLHERRLKDIETHGSSPFLDLHVMVHNLDTQSPEVCSYESLEKHSNWSLALAVRASMSIPLFFENVVIQGITYVDGGTSNNYPINIFDRKKYIDPTLMGKDEGEEYAFNTETLGFRVDTPEDLQGLKKKPLTITKPIAQQGPQAYLMALLDSMVDVQDIMYFNNKNDRNRTVECSSLNVATTDFSITSDTKLKLEESGKQGMIQFIHKHSSNVVSLADASAGANANANASASSKANSSPLTFQYGSASVSSSSSSLTVLADPLEPAPIIQSDPPKPCCVIL